MGFTLIAYHFYSRFFKIPVTSILKLFSKNKKTGKHAHVPNKKMAKRSAKKIKNGFKSEWPKIHQSMVTLAP